MLSIEQSKIEKINLNRFSLVLDDEFRESRGKSPQFASKLNPMVTSCIRKTLSHCVKSTLENEESKNILNNLQSHNRNVVLIPQYESSSTLLNENKETETKHVRATKPQTVRDDSIDIISNQPSDQESGERIQHLLQDQKNLAAKDLAVEQQTQAMLVNELTELTSMLKESTLEINKAVNLQNIQLTSMNEYAAENRDELDNQKKRMKESTTVMTTSLWTSIGLIIWVLVMFSGAYVFIRLIPAPRNYPTCPNPVPYSAFHGDL